VNKKDKNATDRRKFFNELQSAKSRKNKIFRKDMKQEVDHIEEVEADIKHEKQGCRSSAQLIQEVEKLEEELNQSKDKLIRAMAEMENVRRRAQADVEKAHKYGVEKFIKELLPVIDSLEKALEIGVKVEPALHEGVELTYRMILKVLDNMGVKAIDPLGEPFDPEKHEAMSMQPKEDTESNSVITVIQKGYELNGRLVRPAMVIVSS